MHFPEERRSSLGLNTQPRHGKPPLIVGYAAVFDSLSNELPLSEGRKFRELIRRGAFAESLKRDDVIARFEHRDLLGRTGNGTLRLIEDSYGLRFELDMAATSIGRDLLTLIQRGDVRGSSFSFRVKVGGDKWTQDERGAIRELLSVTLIDVSPVASPAYPDTSVAVRSYQEYVSKPSNILRMRLELAERS
jgi:HK97 family phage prohead protease